MEKFSDYQKWIEKIKQRCDKENFISKVIRDYADQKLEYSVYRLDNDIYAYISSSDIVVRDKEFSQNELNYLGSYCEANEFDFPMTNKKDLLIFTVGNVIAEDDEPSIYCELQKNMIRSYLPIQLDEEMSSLALHEVEKDSEQDINKLLLEALERGHNNPNADPDILEKYAEAIEFYNHVSSLVMQKDEQTVNLQDESKITEGIETATEEVLYDDKNQEKKLEELSEEELENLLYSTSESNHAKEEQLKELRKKELIAQIKQEQQNGKELDTQLKEIRAKTTEK